jgi:hypothetical protein
MPANDRYSPLSPEELLKGQAIIHACGGHEQIAALKNSLEFANKACRTYRLFWPKCYNAIVQVAGAHYWWATRIGSSHHLIATGAKAPCFLVVGLLSGEIVADVRIASCIYTNSGFQYSAAFPEIEFPMGEMASTFDYLGNCQVDTSSSLYKWAEARCRG